MQDFARTQTTAAADAAKLAALRRIKALATSMLVLCLAVFLAARSFEADVPALAYVAAFAEAAMIGGLADWYAVVALFKRPLGLPIPHTAIIPSNQERIADNLGYFIEANFLAPEPVRRKLREVERRNAEHDRRAVSRRDQALRRDARRQAEQASAERRRASRGAGPRD